MARLSLNKSALTRQTRQLHTFERFLPALDLKRKQLMAQRARAEEALRETDMAITALREALGHELPMLANPDLHLGQPVRIRAVHIADENIMGTRLPTLTSVELEIAAYGYMVRPHWYDLLVERLGQMLELRALRDIRAQRLALLKEAVRKVTQRVNLFDKVLIPRTRENIRRIRIYLSDAERAAVIRSKIAKGKRQKEGLA